MKLRFIIPLIMFGLLVVLLAAGLKLDPKKVPSPLIGKPAPTFSLPSLANSEQQITPADFKGQVWLLNVWATWCPSCRAEHETLVNFSQQDPIAIVGLNYKDDSTAAKQWLKKLGDPYTVNAVDADGRIAIDWGVYGAPETYIIDQQGIIQHKHIGPVTPEVINKTILPKLAELRGQS